jgi:hypothetical protein
VNRPDLVAEFKQDSVTRASNSPTSSKSVHFFAKTGVIKFAHFGQDYLTFDMINSPRRLLCGGHQIRYLDL